jgi:predicted AlkP superfamily phosphohydrolase/phosphomutase
VPYDAMADCIVVRDPERLLSALGFPDAEAGLAMYPRTSVKLPDEAQASEVKAALEQLELDDDELFDHFHVEGKTVSWAVHARPVPDATVTVAGSERSFDELGLSIEERLGGGNTAYHIPEGILITYGRDIEPGRARDEVEVIEIAPRILELLGVAAPLQTRASEAAERSRPSSSA